MSKRHESPLPSTLIMTLTYTPCRCIHWRGKYESGLASKRTIFPDLGERRWPKLLTLSKQIQEIFINFLWGLLEISCASKICSKPSSDATFPLNAHFLTSLQYIALWVAPPFLWHMLLVCCNTVDQRSIAVSLLPLCKWGLIICMTADKGVACQM